MGKTEQFGESRILSSLALLMIIYLTLLIEVMNGGNLVHAFSSDSKRKKTF